MPGTAFVLLPLSLVAVFFLSTTGGPTEVESHDPLEIRLVVTQPIRPPTTPVAPTMSRPRDTPVRVVVQPIERIPERVVVPLIDRLPLRAGRRTTPAMRAPQHPEPVFARGSVPTLDIDAASVSATAIDMPALRAPRSQHAAPRATARNIDATLLRLPTLEGHGASPTLPAPSVTLSDGKHAGLLVARAFDRTPIPENVRSDRMNTGVRSVPLGRLAACRTDAEEDLLKQQVLASVEAQVTCSSDAGTYRFLETKNLNAFLLYVERGFDREQTDRCRELKFALECLAQHRGKESHAS